MNEDDNIVKETYEYANFTARAIFDRTSDICALILSGSMDTEPVMEFRAKMKERILIHRYDFIVDLDRVTYISSTALGFLMFLAAHKKNTVYLSTPHVKVAKPIKILGIHSMFKSYDRIEELKEKITIPDAVLEYITEPSAEQKNVQYLSRWLKILRDYLAYEQISEEIKILTPYIQQAEHSNNVTVPSDIKYSCILYIFFEKVFRDIAKFDQDEIDDDALEMMAKELMTNAVVHGYNNNREGVVETSYTLDTIKLEINVIDYGKGFPDTDTQPFPKTGLRLLENFFDNIDITEAPKKEVQGLVLGKGTKITLTKNLIPQS
ncbi:MAG: ATP-binding protein [bacterium]